MGGAKGAVAERARLSIPGPRVRISPSAPPLLAIDVRRWLLGASRGDGRRLNPQREAVAQAEHVSAYDLSLHVLREVRTVLQIPTREGKDGCGRTGSRTPGNCHVACDIAAVERGSSVPSNHLRL